MVEPLITFMTSTIAGKEEFGIIVLKMFVTLIERSTAIRMSLLSLGSIVSPSTNPEVSFFTTLIYIHTHT